MCDKKAINIPIWQSKSTSLPYHLTVSEQALTPITEIWYQVYSTECHNMYPIL